jgi:hypothetical protein
MERSTKKPGVSIYEVVNHDGLELIERVRMARKEEFPSG